MFSQKDFFIALPAILISAQSSGQLFSLAPEVVQARSAARSVFALHDARGTIMQEDVPLGSRNFLCRDKTFKKKKETDGTPKTEVSSEPSEKASAGSKGGLVALDSVNLAYPTRPDKRVLHDVTIKVEPGSVVGVVGPSGAGKSTVIHLLERFYDPDTGAVSIDGEDIRKQPVRAHRSRLSLVAQEPGLFAGSVAFNIRLGARAGQEVTQAQLEQVCKQCNVHDFVASLPEGYETECGAGGSQLSGGQKQRIAVARALIRNPRVLLLDEATSALDSHSEREVQKAIAAASADRTTVIVAHRLSSVQHADWIVVLDQGRIAEQGTHAGLAEKGGIYGAMVKAQAVG